MYVAVEGVGFFAQFGNCTIPLVGLDLAGFAKLMDNGKSVGFMLVPQGPNGETAKKFVEYAMKQTAKATQL